jgi:hypothetical protein
MLELLSGASRKGGKRTVRANQSPLSLLGLVVVIAGTILFGIFGLTAMRHITELSRVLDAEPETWVLCFPEREVPAGVHSCLGANQGSEAIQYWKLDWGLHTWVAMITLVRNMKKLSCISTFKIRCQKPQFLHSQTGGTLG